MEHLLRPIIEITGNGGMNLNDANVSSVITEILVFFVSVKNIIYIINVNERN